MSLATDRRVTIALRVLVVVILGLLGAAAVTGSSRMRLFVLLLALPSGWVFVKPRMPQIAVWIMLTSPVTVVGILMTLDQPLFYSRSEQLVGIAYALMVIALPFVRSRAKPVSPADAQLPEATLRR